MLGMSSEHSFFTDFNQLHLCQWSCAATRRSGIDFNIAASIALFANKSFVKLLCVVITRVSHSSYAVRIHVQRKVCEALLL